MKFNYLQLLLLSILFCYSCKKAATTPIEDLPNYYFGKYAPFCGFAPPCSDRFWLINKEGITQIGDASNNIFTSIDSLGQISPQAIVSSIKSTFPVPNKFSVEGIEIAITSASKIHSSCYTFENSTTLFNATNYFVLIPIANNRFQIINLNSCHAGLSDPEKQPVDDLLDWLAIIDEQIDG